ncbi:MAG TPA: hypothetical protein VJZ75_06785 [Candidatus Bathyarchaeia archaeon]|nr:hypothetical protein [Candidatus Bathyarchaeia archaeon]
MNSPVKVITLLRSIANQSPFKPSQLWLAERVACRECGGRNFNHLGENQVECTRCLEKQWYTIEINKERTLWKWKFITVYDAEPNFWAD